MSRVGFIVNPIAGMGGRVGLKGTDGVIEKAIELGAEPVAHSRALETLKELRRLIKEDVEWLTCSGNMGEQALLDAGFKEFEMIHVTPEDSRAKDTEEAARDFVERKVDIILFCGGDGTARDICSVTTNRVPILGIPSGVKMHSGVFGISPARTAEVLAGFLEGALSATEVEIMDLDEDKYRDGEWVVRLYATALTPFESTFIQSSKMMMSEATEDDIKEEIAEYLVEEIEDKPEVLFLLGPGSTVGFVGRELGIDKTLLGIDAVVGKELVGKDLNESRILGLLDKHADARLVLSPIGAQGFVLGRGNLQLSPEVIRRIGRDNILVLSTMAKLRRTPVLRFDTGDAALDNELKGSGYISVVIGYRLSRLVDVSI